MSPTRLRRNLNNRTPGYSRQVGLVAGPYRRPSSRMHTGTNNSIDGVAYKNKAANVILPANKDEYLDAIAGRIPNRSRYLDAYLQDSSDNSINSNRRQWHNKSLGAMKGRLKQLMPGFIAAALIFVAIGGIVFGRPGGPAQAGNYGSLGTPEDNGDTPSEKRPYNEVNYQVADKLPKNLKIDKILVDARIVRTGVRSNSEPKFPTNIYDVGWYENSANPSEGGATVLIGHVSGATKDGVFYNLTALVPGDTIELETGDGTIHHYYIVKMVAYGRNQVDMAALNKSIEEGKPGLNLLTAVGSFEKNSDIVQQLVVYAVENGAEPAVIDQTNP